VQARRPEPEGLHEPGHLLGPTAGSTHLPRRGDAVRSNDGRNGHLDGDRTGADADPYPDSDAFAFSHALGGAADAAVDLHDPRWSAGRLDLQPAQHGTQGSNQNIVLADGTYDNASPFMNTNNRLYVAHVGQAALQPASCSAATSVGRRSGSGLTFDVSDPNKTSAGASSTSGAPAV
jgi:hypothetical protein